MHGELHELGSQQDQNFLIDAHAGRFVLKVSNPAFTADELDLQNRAMEHAAARLPGVVPVAVRGVDGHEIVSAGEHDVRLVTWLEGEPLHASAYLAPVVLRAAGELTARVTGALADFDHPAADRVLQWDVAHAVEVVAAFAPWVRDPGRRSLLERTMDRAATTLAAVAGNLRRQVIHGDPNDLNLLATRGPDGRLVPSALLDFGDCCQSWIAGECAVLAVSLGARRSERLVQDAREVVGGFHAALALTEDEVEALPALMAARAALCAAGCEQQAVLEPDNAYAAQGVEDAWRDVAAVAAVPEALARAAFRAECGLAAPERPAVPRGGPVVAGLDGVATKLLDLSTRTDELAPGAWRDPEAIAAGAEGGTLTVGRHGEGRLVHDRGAALHEPATVHLGADLFLAEGTPVLAPWAGRVVRRAERELVLAAEGDLILRLAGIVPSTEGEACAAGDVVGAVAPPAPGDRLPAHLHIQLAATPVAELPGLVPGSLADAWLAICPDPGPLLGLDVAVAEESPAAVLARRRRVVASPQRLYFPGGPPQFERGWRQWLYDVRGRPYLDMVNNVAVLGHAHPAVEQAAARQLRRLNTNSRFLYDALGRFAERLSGLVPDPLEVVFAVNSGSEAVDLALRLARDTTGRRDVVCFAGAYHGWTSATDETIKGAPWVHPIDPPHRDPTRSLEQLRTALERHPPAALLCEPVLGNWGGVLLPDGWLATAYELVRAAGGLCIADEVQVGYGRSGNHFWAFEQQRVVPDLVTLAKPAGNGHPLGAVIATRAIADRFDAREDLFSSSGGSPVSCEVGLAVLDTLEREGLQENARQVGEHLTARLTPLVDEIELVAALHGSGLYRGLELARPDGSAAGAEAFALCERLLELGVIVQPTGPGMNVLKLKPPLCIAREDVDLLADALRRALEDGW